MQGKQHPYGLLGHYWIPWIPLFQHLFSFFFFLIARPSPPLPLPFHLQFMLQFVDFVDVAVYIFSGPSGCGWDYKHLWFMVSQCSLTEMALFLHPSYSAPRAVFFFCLFCLFVCLPLFHSNVVIGSLSGSYNHTQFPCTGMLKLYDLFGIYRLCTS